jgi:hypothetical protein
MKAKITGFHADIRKECRTCKGHNAGLRGLYSLSQSVLWSQIHNTKYVEIVWNYVVTYFNWHLKSKTWSLQKVSNMQV